MTPAVDSKQCSVCGETKPLDDFPRHRRGRHGRAYDCRKCRAAYDASPDRLARKVAANKRYRSTEKGKSANNAHAVRYHRRHPEKLRAVQLVHEAVQRGDLTKNPCERCGATDQVQGHHDDYSKPLEVRWLCQQCHNAHHRAERGARA